MSSSPSRLHYCYLLLPSVICCYLLLYRLQEAAGIYSGSEHLYGKLIWSHRQPWLIMSGLKNKQGIALTTLTGAFSSRCTANNNVLTLFFHQFKVMQIFPGCEVYCCVCSESESEPTASNQLGLLQSAFNNSMQCNFFLFALIENFTIWKEKNSKKATVCKYDWDYHQSAEQPTTICYVTAFPLSFFLNN